MTNESSHNNPLLDDDRMDQLLAAFYDSEVPEKLDRLPSSWPELHSSSASTTAQPRVTRALETGDPDVQPAPTARRGLAVAAATLAACLVLMVFSRTSDPVGDSGTANVPAPTGTRTQPLVTPDSATFPVSGGETNGAVDENNTTLEEIDGIDLNPPADADR